MQSGTRETLVPFWFLLKEEIQMGFASYLENIVERIAYDLSNVEAVAREDHAESIASIVLPRLHVFIDECKRLLDEISACFDLATDPQVDLAYEVMLLGHQNAYLARKAEEVDAVKEELKAASHRCTELEQELVRTRIKYGGKAADVKEIDRQYRRLEKKYSMLRKGRGLH
jgi:hypothetical protein